MGKRILVAVVFIPVLIIFLFVLPDPAVPIMISVLSMIAVHEVLWSTGFVKNTRLSAYSIILAGVIPFWVFFQEGMLPALCGLLIYLTLVFAEAIASRFTVTLEKMGGCFFFALLIPYFLSSFTRLKEQPEVGVYLVAIPLVTAFTSDAFALFAGMLFGRHKLAPALSPKKTVEGAVGSVFSQLGDLSFSYIKRQYQIKDFGNIFPGHGGVLDRFDSVIFCAPLIEVLCALLPAIKL